MIDGWAEARLRAELVAAGATLVRRGLVRGAEGNLSCRFGKGGVLVTPRGADKGRLAAADLLRCDLDTADAPAASSELPVHVAVYRALPEVAALVHAHPRAVLGLDAGGGLPDPSALVEGVLLVGRIARVEALPSGSRELAEACVEALRGAPVAVLSRHGLLAAGSSVAEALLRTEVVELLATIALATRKGGG